MVTTSGSPTISVYGGSFTSADQGKLITITQVIDSATPSGPSYQGTINSVTLPADPTTQPTQLTLSSNVPFTSLIPQSIAYGTDDGIALNYFSLYLASIIRNGGDYTSVDLSGRAFGTSKPVSFPGGTAARNGTIVALSTGAASAPTFTSANALCYVGATNVSFEHFFCDSNYLPVNGWASTKNGITRMIDSQSRHWLGSFQKVNVSATVTTTQLAISPYSFTIEYSGTSPLRTFMVSRNNSANGVPDRAMIVKVAVPGALATATVSAPGSMGTNGTYSGVPLTDQTTTQASGAVATVQVSGGKVAKVTITSPGQGYASGDVLGADPSAIGNTQGFSAATTLTGYVWINKPITAALSGATLEFDQDANGVAALGAGSGVQWDKLSAREFDPGDAVHTANAENYGCAVFHQGTQSTLSGSVITGGVATLCLDGTTNGLTLVDTQIFNTNYSTLEYNPPAVLFASGTTPLVTAFDQDNFFGAIQIFLLDSQVTPVGTATPPAPIVSFQASRHGKDAEGTYCPQTGCPTGSPFGNVIQVFTDQTSVSTRNLRFDPFAVVNGGLNYLSLTGFGDISNPAITNNTCDVAFSYDMVRCQTALAIGRITSGVLMPSQGVLTIGQALTLAPFTVATLPACTSGATGNVGQTYLVSDANAPVFGSPPVGGGSRHVLVVCEAGGWLVQ